MRMTKFFKKLGRQNSGATAIEYGLIVALIALTALGAIGSVANENSSMWNDIKTDVTDSMGNDKTS